MLKPEFADDFISRVKKAVLDRFFNMSDRELKDIEKDSISKILKDMKDFLQLSLHEEDTDKVLENT